MSADLLLLLGLGAIFSGVVLALGTIGVITTERQAVGRSLAALDAYRAAPDAIRAELERPFGERVVLPSLRRFSTFARRFTPAHRIDRIRHRLNLAGNPEAWDVDRILAMKILGLLVLAPIGVGLCLLLGVNVLATLAIGGALVVLGYMLPNIVLYQVAYNRTERMRRELPDAIDLLTISVEAGLSFDGALSQVARNSTGPLGEEFFRVLQEMQIGMGRTDALRKLGERTDLPELRGFISAMVQADAFGIPIANVLRIQSKEMRIKRSQRAEEQAQKIPVKILFPLIFCIMPVLFIVILGPAVISIFRSFTGL